MYELINKNAHKATFFWFNVCIIKTILVVL